MTDEKTSRPSVVFNKRKSVLNLELQRFISETLKGVY